jgi:hypothetical protein
MSNDVETRSVELAEVTAGVKLRPGHRVVLVVSGVKGTKRYASTTRARNEDRSSDPEQTAEEAAEPAERAFVIDVQLHAAGGTPLANERVRIHDPDTGEQVAHAVTDENGVLEARVPAEKDYQFFVDAEQAEDHPDEFAGLLQPPPRDSDEHAMLLVAFVDAGGQPVKAEAVRIKTAHGNSQDATTDDHGKIELIAEPGIFTLEVRGKSFVAHSVFPDDLGEAGGIPCKFVLR